MVDAEPGHTLPYRLFFDSSNDAMLVIPLSDDGRPERFQDANPSACRLLGYSREELLRVAPQDLGRDFALKLWDDTLASVRQSGEASFMTSLHRRGQSLLWVEVSLKRIELEGKTLAIAIARDISEQVAAEQALRENERDLQALINAHPESVILAAEDSRVLHCNQVAAKRLGSSPEGLVGQSLLDLSPPDIRANRNKILNRIIESGEPGTFQDFRNGMHLDHTVTPVGLGARKDRVAIFSRDVTGEFVRDCIENLLGDIDRCILKGGNISNAAVLVCDQLARAFNSPWVCLGGAIGGPYHGGTKSAAFKQQLRDLQSLLEGVRAPKQPCFRPVDELPAALVGRLKAAQCDDVALVPIGFSAAEQSLLLIGLQYGDGLRDGENLELLGHVASRLRVAWGMTQELQQLNLLRQALETARTAALLVTTRGRIVWCNRALADAIRTTEAEILGRQTREFLRDTNQSSLRSIETVVKAGEVWTGESEIRRADGSVFTALQSVSPVLDDDGTLGHYIIIQEDITERKKSQARIRYLAEHDPLTGVQNRMSLMATLDALLDDGRRSVTELALLYLDIDYFKAINDTYGHDVGDQLLTELAQRIVSAVRKEDLVCRLGGDEFVVVLRGIGSTAAAESVAGTLLASINQPIRCGDHWFSVGASMGISVATAGWGGIADRKATNLLREADDAMYLAKRSGRNQYRLFSAAPVDGPVETGTEVSDRR